ncbi:MAG: CRISPR-associated endonuclease/helicase Cas3 [Deltaproteobacteria bacterium ADurb.Bin135]|nr:MAG: CRISPR-associated endonuclease/helicase Cas3 [Deltaproteobacteria bacterium ADurb.Bin135]
MKGTIRDMEKAFTEYFLVKKPFSFQLKVAYYLLSGRNVILQAPTGSGKTKAALFPFFYAQESGLEFPSNHIYTVPMRVLARGFYKDLITSKTLNSFDIRLQTGEQQDDPKFEGDVVFATIDQVLSSFLNIPYSLSMRQGNMNAGAIISSYLVFDEFHLFNPDSTLPTCLETLRILKGIAPFLLMTATFSKEMLLRLASLLDAEVVLVGQDEIHEIPSQINKNRYLFTINNILTADAVIKRHKTQSIAICNTVERSQDLFEEVCSKVNSDTMVILLHSRFLKEDRKKKEEAVERFFGKNRKEGESVILIATQVVEVGLDITCEVMHTEIAPASSILQRAGRCARFEGETGHIYVYQVPLNKKGEPNYAPYLEGQEALAKKTWEILPMFERRPLNFAEEQDLINQVHAEIDTKILEGLEQTKYFHRQEMNKVISQQEIGLARKLIRNDSSINILVHPEPGKIENPYELEAFSLFSGTLHGQFEKWQDSGLPNEEASWLIMYPQEQETGEGENLPIHYKWIEVKNQKDIRISSIHAINPRLVKYTPEIGFNFTPKGNFQSPVKSVQKEEENRKWQSYQREDYQEHIQKTLVVYKKKLSKELVYAANRLEQKMGLSTETIDRAILFAIAMHDVGKMDRRWQGWAMSGKSVLVHRWQRAAYWPIPTIIITIPTIGV